MKETYIHGIQIKYHESTHLVHDKNRAVILSKNLDEIHCVIDFNVEDGNVKNINIKPRFNIDITIEDGVYIFDVNYVED
ncbi:hypothetical protein ERX27_08885 [Macrococcus brunensis]|uniref:Uncharacterized protein n=1 Tax=Macrococcus brunensis TaxID=198483 RepID=A0A4R6BBR3_9STAP|nr:hypothetical protein [Macrococcus brunensis]TDL95259.1 hypothetical protein ERX27_08885 [Macrococcus brunensis]